MSQAEYVDLSFPPKKTDYYVEDDASGEPSTLQANCLIKLEVTDDRSNKGQVGKIAGGLMGEIHTPVLTEHSVTSWVYDAVVFELQSIGCVGTQDDVSAGGSDFSTLTVTIASLSSDCYAISCGAIVELRSELRISCGEVRETTQIGKKGAAAVGMSYGPGFTEALARSLQEAVQLSLDAVGVRRSDSCRVESGA